MAYIDEKIVGVVQRVTYHNPENGWSVLKVQPFSNPGQQVTVTVHQTKVFAGATMEFHGSWMHHQHFGRQFKASQAIEKKPASAGALEKYLGSGLIKGVGPKTARKIVNHFGQETLSIFEESIDALLDVPGIADKKLQTIKEAWQQHRMIREVMLFLQGHGISTLFAVRIFKKYGNESIDIVSRDPYLLANDFYGIGFFSADKVALSIGFAIDSEQRLVAAIRHVLSAGREQGHCYLTRDQIEKEVEQLLELHIGERIDTVLQEMEDKNHLRVRVHRGTEAISTVCYYAKSLYYDEEFVAVKVGSARSTHCLGKMKTVAWVKKYCAANEIELSDEQVGAVSNIVQHPFSVLTGGPGCGKTTTTLVIVRLLEFMGKKVMLAAPTGRAAQRMSEVIGRESKTIHRLLGWQFGAFQHNEEQPLEGDFLIVDECSMLDISLTASLLKAVPKNCHVLFIGDADQLPSVGAGNVLQDIIQSETIPCFRLTKIFRQARESNIIQYAHEINRGNIPRIESPFKYPEIWQGKNDCLFIDSDEATSEQLRFIVRAKKAIKVQTAQLEGMIAGETPYTFRTAETIHSSYQHDFEIPPKFTHVDLVKLSKSKTSIEELKSVLRKVHPWSTLHYGLTAVQTVVNLYLEWIPKYYGSGVEIQILTPMTRGSLGTANLNNVIQLSANPPAPGKPQIQVGERTFRVGDRVIHRRNNYDLHVFNGDIGIIGEICTENLTMTVLFTPEGRAVEYQKEDIIELDLAYAITIHKSQGSEFSAVILPVVTQHFKMLYRNLIYTGLTRARKLAVFVGTRKAMALAVHQQDSILRQTALKELLQGNSAAAIR